MQNRKQLAQNAAQREMAVMDRQQRMLKAAIEQHPILTTSNAFSLLQAPPLDWLGEDVSQARSTGGDLLTSTMLGEFNVPLAIPPVPFDANQRVPPFPFESPAPQITSRPAYPTTDPSMIPRGSDDGFLSIKNLKSEPPMTPIMQPVPPNMPDRIVRSAVAPSVQMQEAIEEQMQSQGPFVSSPRKHLTDGELPVIVPMGIAEDSSVDNKLKWLMQHTMLLFDLYNGR